MIRRLPEAEISLQFILCTHIIAWKYLQPSESSQDTYSADQRPTPRKACSCFRSVSPSNSVNFSREQERTLFQGFDVVYHAAVQDQ